MTDQKTKPFTPQKAYNWDNKYQYRFRLSLQKKGDADILFRLAQEDNQSAFVRKALRWYIEHEDQIEDFEREAAHHYKLAFPTANKTTAQ